MTKPSKYRLLQKHLADRYADTVVLTFGQIEDLLGFGLPSEARTHVEWWTMTHGDGEHAGWSDAWLSASRTARPNLPAGHVVFERLAARAGS